MHTKGMRRIGACSTKAGILGLKLLLKFHFVSPPKQVPCGFSLNLPLFGLGPSFKGLGTNLKLSTNKIA
jgi:hypothetical protein